jgi:integrase
MLLLALLDYLERERHNATRSRNARLAALRSFLKYAAHYDLNALPIIEQALAVPMKRFERPMLGFLSREEIDAVLDAPEPSGWTGQRDRALLTMLYNTGARVSEVVAIRIKDVILDHSPCVHLHAKGRKNRSVPLWQSTAKLMRKWKRCLHSTEDSSYLFPNRAGTEMTRSNVAQRLALAVSSAAIKCSSLRRLADQLADRGEPNIDGGSAQAMVDHLSAVLHQEGTADGTAGLRNDPEELIEGSDIRASRMRRYQRVREHPPQFGQWVGGLRRKEKRQRHRFS